MPGSEIVWAIKALWEALEAEDLPRAKDIHAGISRLIAFQFSLDAYVAVEKYLLVKQGIFSSVRQRGPVGVILSTETKQSIDKVFEDLVNIVAG
jgi:dihydrodipicolinate synthase/N-acetylneuraminate lyase